MRRLFKVACRLGLALILASLALPVASQSSIDKIDITQTDADDFPQITVQARILDPADAPVTGLTAADLKLFEDGVPVTGVVLTEKTVGIQVAWVIDAGTGIGSTSPYGKSRGSVAKDIILAFVDSGRYAQNKVDANLVLASTGSGTRQISPLTSDVAAVGLALQQYTPAPEGNSCPVLPAVSEALDDLHDSTTGSDQPRSVVALVQCDPFDASLLDSVIQKATTFKIPVYVILLRSAEDEGASGNLSRLARDTGGQYLPYLDTVTSTSGFFGNLSKHRTQYALTYRSKVSVSGKHSVRVEANTGASGAPGDDATYEIVISAPQVAITAPQPGSKIPCEVAEAIHCRVDPATQTIVAHVTWPDNHPRRVKGAQLLINGQDRGTLEAPNDPGHIGLPWDLSAHDIVADTIYEVQVIATDELGLSAKSDPIQVTVGAVSSPPSSLWFYASVVLSVLAIVLAVVALLVLWRNRDRIVESVSKGAGEIFTNLGLTRGRGRKVQAYLIALEGLEDGRRKQFDLYDGETRIGRYKRDADLVFQSDEISRKHLTLSNEEGYFAVRDEDSANGTYLDGDKLKPFEWAQLNDGAQLELGQVERGGIHVLFKLADLGGDGDAPTVPGQDESETQPKT